MDSIWLDNYPPGVPRHLDLDPTETLVDAFETAATAWHDRPAFTNLGHTLDFSDIDELSQRFAAYTQRELGLVPGDRIAIMLPNTLQYPVALFGALRAGLVVVNVNPLYTAPELEHQLLDSGARAIVVYAGSAHVLAQVIEQTAIEHVLVSEIADLLPTPKRQFVNFVVRRVKRLVPEYALPDAVPFRAIFDVAQGAYKRPKSLTGGDLAVLQYTGGTTGLSKGAMLTHANILANVSQVNSWFGGNDSPGKEIIITALPLYHVYALTVNCFAYFEKGGLNVLITDPRDTAALISEIKKWRFTAITGVNTLFQSLVRHPDFASVDFSTLKVVSAGGMAMQEATAREWARITGTQVIEGYGLSETSPVVSSNALNITEFTGTIGLPLPETEVSIRDEDGHELAVGEAGELAVRGPQVMLGYWNQPEATESVMTADGYLLTGDMAVMDESGYLRIVDRKKDIIIVSGLKVYPNQLENTITGHPDVLEAAVIGVPDADSGEGVKLFAVRRPGAELTEADLRLWCKSNMAAYKVPGEVEFMGELPKSNVGKVLRRELRELDAAQRTDTAD